MQHTRDSGHEGQYGLLQSDRRRSSRYSSLLCGESQLSLVEREHVDIKGLESIRDLRWNAEHENIVPCCGPPTVMIQMSFISIATQDKLMCFFELHETSGQFSKHLSKYLNIHPATFVTPEYHMIGQLNQ